MRRIKRLIHWIRLIINDEPIKTWRKLPNGKYICDGDCKRWSLHGVCTCGLCHHFKIEEGGYNKIERDNVSWHREAQTEDVMMYVEYENECPHGLSWNDKCDTCEIQIDKLLKELFQ